MFASGAMVLNPDTSFLQKQDAKQEIVATTTSASAKVTAASTSTKDSLKSVGASDGTATTSTKTINKNLGLDAKVRTYFADIPVMVEVSRCESHYRQYDTDGTVFRGKVNNSDVGLMQVNEYYHLERATKLGYDIHSVDGNLAYARLLYKEQGTQPWISSSPCWGKYQAKLDAAAKVAADAKADTNLIAGTVSTIGALSTVANETATTAKIIADK